MIDHAFQEVFPSHFGRKILQMNSSSSSLNTSQPIFIALLCIIAVLTIALVITVIILCYRYYSHREQKFEKRRKHRHKFPRTSSFRSNHPQSTVPISVTPTSASSYSVRSSDQLVSNQHRQNVSINTLPSRRFQQSLIDAYLKDLNSSPPAPMDVQQLNSYLFIDLHSTSSETFPDNISKQFLNNTITSGHNTSMEDESQRKPRFYHKNQQRRRSALALKRSHNPRFLMRERSLSHHLHQLPQLRQLTTQQQRHLFGPDDTNNSSTTMMNQDLQSTTISTTTDDYDDSHAYNVNQHQIMQTIKEEKPFIVQQDLPHLSFQYEKKPYFFELVSTSRDDYTDIQTLYKSSPMIDKRMTYIKNATIV